MKLTITITCDNAAFEGEFGGNEIGRILTDLADEFLNDSLAHIANSLREPTQIRDINGNAVGSVTFFR